MSSSSPMAVPSSKISRDTIATAIDALLNWMRSQSKQRKPQLLDHDDLLYLVLTVKRIPPSGRINPHRIPLPHPLHSLDSSSICLIVDDRPSSPLSPSAARARILADSLPVAEVIGLSDLRSDYRPFEARRRLCGSHDLFFADRRILPLLPRLLGKQFFRRKKIPLAVDFSRKGWPEQIRHCCASTLLYLRTGTCSGLKVGRVSQDREEIVDNVAAAIDGAVEYVPRKWGNVRSLHIKAVDSLALPIYQAVPELGLKIESFQKKKVLEILEGDVIQMGEGEAEKDEVAEKSSGGNLKKRKKKSGRIHEVSFMDMVPDNDSDDFAAMKSGGKEAVGGKTGTEKKKKQKVDVESPKEKGTKRGRNASLLSRVVNEDVDQTHLAEHKIASGADKRTRKEKAGKDQKIKRNINVDEKENDEHDAEKGKKKKDIIAKKGKLQKGKISDKDVLMLSGDAATMEKKSKKEKPADKALKKTKRSKVMHAID